MDCNFIMRGWIIIIVESPKLKYYKYRIIYYIHILLIYPNFYVFQQNCSFRVELGKLRISITYLSNP